MATGQRADWRSRGGERGGGGGAEGRVLQILCASVEVCAEIWALVTQGQSKSCLHAEGKYASGRREGDGAGGMRGGGGEQRRNSKRNTRSTCKPKNLN